MPEAEKLHNPGVAVEHRDVPLWLYAALALGLTVFFVVCAVALRFVYPDSLHGPSNAPRIATALPALQVNPAADLAAYLAAQDRALNSYGWVDRKAGVVRIPIARAMRDVAAGGIKDWPRGVQ